MPHPLSPAPQRSGLRAVLALAGFFLLTFCAAGVGAFVGPGDWYRELAKPAWNPPAWVFGPVWTVLYAMMAIAAWRVWRAKGFGGARPALVPYFIQLTFNALWSILFFGLHRPDLAFADILCLWLAIVATTVLFFRADRPAGWLMVPYLAWVTFASVLNFTIWRMNV